MPSTIKKSEPGARPPAWPAPGQAERPGTLGTGGPACPITKASAHLLAILIFCALVFTLIPPVAAQVTTLPPVRNKVKNPKARIDSFQGEVVNFSNVAITVRDRKNLAAIRTFSYSPELTRKMESRRIEPGERVTVRFMRNTETAVGLKGKIQRERGPYVSRPSR